MAAFEAAKLGRKAIAFDLNPLSSFTIEVLASPFDEWAFRRAFEKIVSLIQADSVYQKHYTRKILDKPATIFNYRWDGNRLAKIAAKIDGTGRKKQKTIFRSADSIDTKKVEEMASIAIPYWYPQTLFPNTPSINHKFILDIGGNSFEYLWTRRNLYLLAKIFDEIRKEPDANVQKQLLSGFIQTLHLTSKMVVPRNVVSNRDFSGSWGRADYMIRRRSMEQNPLVVFRRSCIEKQGVIAAMRDARASLPEVKIHDVRKTGRLNLAADINYGIVDAADMTQYVKPKSIDFIITDPPYAGLVFYLDLSLVWLVWLQKLDSKYAPDMRSEITIKKGQTGRDEYRRRLRFAFEQLHNCLKDDGRIVITFHHKKLVEWNEFVHAVQFAGFKPDKITHQYNKRSGESNVSNPYGTSGADFYVRCVKHRDVDFTDDKSQLKHFIVEKVKEIVAQRNEPTPYTFVFDALIPELLQAGFISPQDYQDEVDHVLSEQVGKIFTRTPNKANKAGDLWWFVNPRQYINYPNVALKDRVEETVISLLRRKISVRLDDVLAELFRAYPNGLTPDPRSIKNILEKYAYPAAGRWKIKDTTIVSATKHTEVIRQIVSIGRKTGAVTYVGKREQPESYQQGATLADLADLRELSSLSSKYNAQQIERIEMIDALWLNKSGDAVETVFEVENSTGFMSAIQRASNLERAIPKFMIIPERRLAELLGTSDPLFKTSFAENHWRYAPYDSIARLTTYSHPSIDEVNRISMNLL